MGTITLKRTDSGDTDFRLLIKELDTDLRQRNGDVMDIYDGHNVIEQIDTVVIAYLDGRPLGCGCFKNYRNDTVEIKRMYVRPGARGKGISRMILTELENWAKSLGFRYVVLETGTKQQEALGLYNRAGYSNIPSYPPYIDLPDSICFKKSLLG
ncbi:MAG: GNAT family N-acetyltransferase [Bacteroidota bacterium]